MTDKLEDKPVTLIPPAEAPITATLAILALTLCIVVITCFLIFITVSVGIALACWRDVSGALDDFDATVFRFNIFFALDHFDPTIGRTFRFLRCFRYCFRFYFAIRFLF